VRHKLKRCARLTRFDEDPRIPLDNKAAERVLRGPVVGRKNHSGPRSVRGTEVAAAFYTLCETASWSASIRVHRVCVPSTRQSAHLGRLRSLKTCSRQP
jgi:transposase IS66 family protein